MKKIEHVGTVVEVDGDKALVQLRSTEGCGVGMRCASCTLLPSGARRIRVDRGDLEEGDVVCVSVRAYSAYVSTFVVFVLPIVLMMAGGAVGATITGTAAHDLPIVVGGLCGLALGVLVAIAVDRRMAGAGSVEVRQIRQGEL